MDEIRDILVTLPRDRRGIGTLTVFAGASPTRLGDLPCLGKADNARAADKGNPDRDPVLPFGDTPLGLYEPARIVLLDPPHPRVGRYFLRLDGEDGPALRAAENGRTGLGIHGGRGDRLVPTYGCLRLRDRDMAALAAELDGALVRVLIEELIG